MKIEIWSDVMCPFCYIGKRHFETALEKLPFKNEVEVEWKSFQLDPTLSTSETKNTVSYLMDRKGFSENQSAQMVNQVSKMGKMTGLDFNFDQALVTNTFPAHKLLQLSKKYHQSSEIGEALFKAHFVHGENVADTEFLISLADEWGIDADKARQALTSDQFDREVIQDISEAQHNGIRSVPFFILNGKYAVSGAQPVEIFENALQQAYEETVSSLKDFSDDGNACDADGCTN